MPNPTLHSAGDGRGSGAVFVNGNEIKHVLWCDTATGTVVFVPQPMRVKRNDRDEVYTRRLRGQVRVFYNGGVVQPGRVTQWSKA
ncbi:hypothetical protein CXB42_05150 [Pseudomonas syringae pv. syringae]|uniref:Uncharacterized protein n=1 Tax=Pseudomonas syringae pv. syringae TaxID=321 RepID=A0AAE5SAL5_PSESY|nr:hypothetical protein CXB42_05150 [Pseudomonas syringae pv. syringae]